MVPRKKNGKIVLVCTRCGYEMEANENDLKSYMASSKAGKESHVKTTGEVSEVETASSEKNKEELEQARENYYELVLDQLGEYGD